MNLTPFFLRRLFDAPMTLTQLADATSSDAPATTVAVNDLEDRSLVVRNPHPDNKRAKLVSLTPAGRKMIERVQSTVRDDAPASMQGLSKTDLAYLRRIVEKVGREERQ